MRLEDGTISQTSERRSYTTRTLGGIRSKKHSNIDNTSEGHKSSYSHTDVVDGKRLNMIYDGNFQGPHSKKDHQRKKHHRRCAKELIKDFPCLYNCGKAYATEAARNMHMREKHNEVTKTERDKKARDIIRRCGLKNNSEIVNKLS